MNAESELKSAIDSGRITYHQLREYLYQSFVESADHDTIKDIAWDGFIGYQDMPREHLIEEVVSMAGDMDDEETEEWLRELSEINVDE